VTNSDNHNEIIIVVSRLDETGNYQLSLDEIGMLENSVPAGGSAIFLSGDMV
jgi:hypothetical protein